MKKKITEELNKFSQMNKEQKISYYKSYYLLPTIALLIGLILLLWFIKDTFFQKKAVNSGCVYGVEITEEEKYALTEGYLDYYDYNKKKYCAYLSTDNMFENTEQQMDANAHEMALIAQITAGDIYYLIYDKENLLKMENGGVYASLSDLFSDEALEKMKDSLIELKNPETGESYPAAIDIKKAGMFGGKKDGYLIFTIGIPDDEYPKRFLEYLLSM